MSAVEKDLMADSDTQVVVGLGATGLSCARYLAGLGLAVQVVDSRTSPPAVDTLQRDCPDVELTLGGFPRELLLHAGRLVVSPGVSLEEPAIAEALAAGVPVCGDIDLFMAAARAPVVGITGSNAKSTVTSLLGGMARRAGLRVAVGGNLGPPALDLLDDAVELYVLELSSFQLERSNELGLDVATVLNVSDDHLDRHGSLEAYRSAKHRIFQGCRAVVVNRDDPRSAPRRPLAVLAHDFGLDTPGERGFGVSHFDGRDWLCQGRARIMPVDELAMVGRHNVANALAALALGLVVGLPVAAMVDELREFTGLEHRCQLVAESSGVRFIDDSKATNPGATLAALEGMAEGRNIVLIAGGQGKGADFSQLAAVVQDTCKAVVVLGEDADQMQAVFAPLVTVRRADTLDDAVDMAVDIAGAGDVVLLSPACASFDMFSGFAERGRCFAAAVAARTASGETA